MGRDGDLNNGKAKTATYTQQAHCQKKMAESISTYKKILLETNRHVADALYSFLTTMPKTAPQMAAEKKAKYFFEQVRFPSLGGNFDMKAIHDNTA